MLLRQANRIVESQPRIWETRRRRLAEWYGLTRLADAVSLFVGRYRSINKHSLISAKLGLEVIVYSTNRETRPLRAKWLLGLSEDMTLTHISVNYVQRTAGINSDCFNQTDIRHEKSLRETAVLLFGVRAYSDQQLLPIKNPWDNATNQQRECYRFIFTSTLHLGVRSNGERVWYRKRQTRENSRYPEKHRNLDNGDIKNDSSRSTLVVRWIIDYEQHLLRNWQRIAYLRNFYISLKRCSWRTCIYSRRC